MSPDEKEEEDDELDEFELERRRNTVGVIAESGVIESVVLRNFVNHTFFEINLGAQINFVTGSNGSGKSAVLTAISVALGGAAKASNRASKSSGLVKDGEDHAIVEVCC